MMTIDTWTRILFTGYIIDIWTHMHLGRIHARTISFLSISSNFFLNGINYVSRFIINIKSLQFHLPDSSDVVFLSPGNHAVKIGKSTGPGPGPHEGHSCTIIIKSSYVFSFRKRYISWKGTVVALKFGMVKIWSPNFSLPRFR